MGHGYDAFFWTDAFENPPTCDQTKPDAAGYALAPGGCKMVNGMGIVVGKYGRILRTTDGGHTWENVPSPTSSHLHSISMNEENTHVRRRMPIRIGAACFVHASFALDRIWWQSGPINYDPQEDTAWAVGAQGTILQTTDRGASFQDISNDVIR